MNDKKLKEFEALQEKVFGKNAPRRDIKNSMSDLLQEARLVEENLSSLQKELQNNSHSINEELLRQSEEIKNLTSIDQDMLSLEKELQNDFHVKEIKTELDVERIKQCVYGQDKAIEDSVMAFARPFIFRKSLLKILSSMLILGPRGSGKHTLIQTIGKELNRDVITIDLSKYATNEDEKIFIQDVYSALKVEHSIVVFEHPESFFTGYMNMFTSFFINGSLPLKKRYVLNKGQLQEMNNAFVENVVSELDAKDHYLVLVSDLKKNKLVDILGMDFMNSVPDIIETSSIDSHIEELITSCLEDILDKVEDITIDDSIKDVYRKSYIAKEGGHSLDACSDSILSSLQQFVLEHKDTHTFTLTYHDGLYINDIPVSLDKRIAGVDIEEIKKELDDIVGLQEVKQYVLSLEDTYKIQKLREQKGLKNVDMSKHMIFTGNPGTGKTTIARLIAKYLRAIGILSGGQLVEVTRANLVGKYVGHTAPLTSSVIASALGGVLFIDEAYSLYRGKDDSFGLECIDTLVKEMEDHRDNLIVILAGYKKEMEAFLESNSGLKSRFPNIVDFKDYSADELVQIACSTAKSKDYFISEECLDPLYKYFEKVQKDDSQMSGNGRMARNKVEEAIRHQSTRLLKEDNADIQELRLCDFNFDESSFVR